MGYYERSKSSGHRIELRWHDATGRWRTEKGGFWQIKAPNTKAGYEDALASWHEHRRQRRNEDAFREELASREQAVTVLSGSDRDSAGQWISRMSAVLDAGGPVPSLEDFTAAEGGRVYCRMREIVSDDFERKIAASMTRSESSASRSRVAKPHRMIRASST